MTVTPTHRSRNLDHHGIWRLGQATIRRKRHLSRAPPAPGCGSGSLRAGQGWAFMRQAVACAIAVASYGGARYAAKEEIRAARRGNGSEAADDGSGVGELLPEPAVAA